MCASTPNTARRISTAPNSSRWERFARTPRLPGRPEKCFSSVHPVVVTGGIEAWKKAGHPIKSEKGPIALERQVRIAAGALVLTGLLVPGLGVIPYVVGAGLVFAGISNTCAMGMALARLPWNRPKSSSASAACPATR